MAVDWPPQPLGKLVQNFDSRRVPLSSREREKRRGRFPYHGATGVMDYIDDFLFEGLHLLVGEDGSVETTDGNPFLQLVDGRFWVNNHAHVLKGKTDVETWFIYYALSTVAIRPFMSGSVQAKLSQGNLNRIPISYPPQESTRLAITHILGTLDDKIGLNRRMNATLEAMARALFQSWFVDFDPVRAKLDGRKPAALDPATAALFPEHFHDSAVGPVPKGWKVERFDAHITADRGLSYKGEGLRDDRSGLPMHNLNSVYEGGGYKHEGLKYYAGEYREKHLLHPGDMIVTNTEQGFDHLLIGHAAIVPRCYGAKGIYSHHIYRVRHKPTSPFSPHYLVELFNNRRWHYWISGFSNGTTINMLPMDALEMPMLVVPPLELVKKFTALAEAAHIQVEDNKQQSRTLATLRDTLLPKLLSGELSLPAALLAAQAGLAGLESQPEAVT